MADGQADQEAQGNGTHDHASLHGYPKLAALMNTQPTTTIFRRFNNVAILNILRLQAELQDMERLLFEEIARDYASQDETERDYCNDFYLMRDKLKRRKQAEASLRNSQEGRDRTLVDGQELLSTKQIECITKIGLKLQEYDAAVHAATRLSRLPDPSADEVSFLQNWLDRPSGGSAFLIDTEKETWEDKNVRDLMTLSERPLANDLFTRAVGGPFVKIYHRIWGRRKSPTTAYREYSDQKITRFSRTVGTIVGSLLPTLTILVLYFVRPPLVRIGLMVLFTALFSLALSIFSNVRSDGIFTATATFAAVEVVFIGTTSNTTTR